MHSLSREPIAENTVRRVADISLAAESREAVSGLVTTPLQGSTRTKQCLVNLDDPSMFVGLDSDSHLAPQLASHKAHAPSITTSSAEIVDLGNALRQQIIASFAETVQAMRREQKDTETCMSSVRQEMRKTTGEILFSCQRMELDIEQCHGLLKDVMNNMCIQPKDLQNDLANRSSVRTVGFQVPKDVSAGSAPTLNGMSAAGSTQQSNSDAETSQGALWGPAHQVSSLSTATVHTQMLHKIQAQARQRERAKRFVETQCECYHSNVVPAFLVKLVHNSAFNNFCALITLAFAVVVGFDADIQVRAVMDDKSIPAWLAPVVSSFNIWFVVEVTVRMFTDGIHYFLDDRNWRWKFFDFVIAVLSLVDMFAETGSFGFLRLLRALKVAKALRVVKMLRMFHGLRLLIATSLSSFMSLIWSLAFLVIVMYLVAVILLNAVAASIKHDETRAETFTGLYTSLSQTMYTLLLSITNGIDWKEPATPIWHLGWFYGGIFILYILFCLFGILNVITSIFVEHATNMARHDHDYAVSEELRLMEDEIYATIALFETLIEDGVREITIEHLEDILRNKRVIAHFASIGIEISDTTFIAHVLGDTSGGLVDTRAFVHGCLSLRGSAKQSDTLSIILHVKKVEETLEKMLQLTSRNSMLLAQHDATSGNRSMNDIFASANLDSPKPEDAFCTARGVEHRGAPF